MPPSNDIIAAIRFGYGFHPEQTAPRDAQGLIASLARGDAAARAAEPGLGGPTLAEQSALFVRFAELRSRNKNDDLRPQMRRINRRITKAYREAAMRRLLTPVKSDHGFFERLAWFWADHFAVSARTLHGRALTPRFEMDAIRPFITGSFRTMLRAATTHPAMVRFLNQDGSVGPNSEVGENRGRGLNENLAREVIELHTLGVNADYTQNDVREFAELLTGLTFDRETGETLFLERRAEPGAETVLGVEYGGGRADLSDIHAALDDLAAHPSTGRNIATKLARHFVSDTPSDQLVTHIESAFNRTDGRLTAVYEALLEHPESWESFGAKVKQPFDFVVSSLRAVGPTEEEFARLLDPEEPEIHLFRHMRRLNQVVYAPPGPQGWPEEAEAWITPQGLANRINWTSALARVVADRWDPRNFLTAALSDIPSQETRFAATRAAERWEGLALTLASPEFNRR